eukprot:6094607-Pyramimonas_sp.AAC.1
MRDIEFLHAFCGADSPGRYMRARGRSVATFDVANDASEDIMTCAGMLWLTILCYRLVRGGAAHFGVECKSFSWISRFTSGRSDVDIMGHDHMHSVSVGNTMA